VQATTTASAEDDTTDPHEDLVVEDQGGQDESSSDPVIEENIGSLAQPLLKNRKKGKGSSKKAGTGGFAEHEII
jgi:hypothetical protein